MYIGTNLCYDVGTLKYVQASNTDPQQIDIIIGSSVAGMLVLSLFIIFIIICCYIIRSKEKNKQYVHMLMELKEAKMADKYKNESGDDYFTGMTIIILCLYA